MPTLTEKDIRAKADEWGLIMQSIAPQVEAAGKLEKDVIAWLKTTGRNMTIEGEIAIAEYAKGSKFGDREIDPVMFLSAARETRSTSEEIYGCISVEVKKAEALLGKAKIDEISHRPTKTKIKATLELK